MEDRKCKTCGVICFNSEALKKHEWLAHEIPGPNRKQITLTVDYSRQLLEMVQDCIERGMVEEEAEQLVEVLKDSVFDEYGEIKLGTKITITGV